MKKTEVLYLLVLEVNKNGVVSTITSQKHWDINDDQRPTFSEWYNKKIEEFYEIVGDRTLIVRHSNIIES